MEVVHSTVNGGDQTYNTVTINVGWCIITGVDPPSVPSDLSYIIFDTEMTITLTPLRRFPPADMPWLRISCGLSHLHLRSQSNRTTHHDRRSCHLHIRDLHIRELHHVEDDRTPVG